jgi:SAM-dependent methyltransferase
VASSLRDYTDVAGVIQAIRLELYRENVGGALELARAAWAAHADPRYRDQIDKINGWLSHLDGREAYIAAQEDQYKRLRWRLGLKFLEKRLRVLLGRKTAKLVRRRAAKPEFVLLEREVQALGPARVLDGGAGEGGAALALAARHPGVGVDAVEVSPTNVKLARQLNRFSNLTFHNGLLEEVHLQFPPATFDLVYSFAVLEHVRDVDATLASMLTVLKPGGRLCFVVPMHEFAARGPLPEYAPRHGYCDHVRVFTEVELRRQFGHYPGLSKLHSPLKPGEFPDSLEVLEFGAFFVAFSKPA